MKRSSLIAGDGGAKRAEEKLFEPSRTSGEVEGFLINIVAVTETRPEASG